MKRDYLPGTPYTIIQNDACEHFNSDTELLGKFMHVNRNDTVLDIGCSSGACMLYAAMHHPAEISGIDLNQEITDTARKNLTENGLPENLRHLYTMPVQSLKGMQFDAIVCNPPYFSRAGKNVPKDTVRKTARHDSSLTLKELFDCVSVLLRDSGTFCMVFRTAGLQEIMTLADSRHLNMTRMKAAYRSEGKPSVSCAMEFSFHKKGNLVLEPPAYYDRKETFDSERSVDADLKQH